MGMRDIPQLHFENKEDHNGDGSVVTYEVSHSIDHYNQHDKC
jgi:hypothetical protein